VYYDRANSAWIASLALPAREPGDRQRRLKRSHKAKEAAERTLAEWHRLYGIGLDLAEDPTVAEYLEGYIANVLPVTQRNRTTFDGHVWALRRYVIPNVGGIRLRELRVRNVEAIFTVMAAEGLSESSIVRVKTNLSSALKHAQRKDLAERNVALLAVLPPLAAEQIEPRKAVPFSDEDLAKVMRVIDRDPYEAMWLVQLWAGCRPGEAAALEVGDCDWDQMAIHITKARTRGSGRLGIGNPKTPRSVRSLVVLERVLDALLRAQDLPERLRREAGTRWEEHGLLFPSRRGTVLDPSNQRRLLRKLLRNAGVTNHYTPYSFRHTFATRYANDGDMPIEHLAPYMGHTDSRMLERVYIHPRRGVDERGLVPGIRVYERIMKLMGELPDEDEVAAAAAADGPAGATGKEGGARQEEGEADDKDA